MKLGSFDLLVRALDSAGVRYLVAGGLAVNAHGYLRFTRDVDLVLQLAPENIVSAFGALEGIGYRPLVRVTAADFADVAKRTAWIRDKGMIWPRPGKVARVRRSAFRLDPIAHPDERDRRPTA